MRISDWSSDVCSSDLGAGSAERDRETARERSHDDGGPQGRPRPGRDRPDGHAPRSGKDRAAPAARDGRVADDNDLWRPRSEEHTSELQSLMRISSAVFCLKKKI